MSTHGSPALTLIPAPAPLVLVAADDLTHRAIVSRMVRTLGFPVRTCPGSMAGLRYLADHPRRVRLLLADLGMRRMDGGELAERARDLDPRLHVVLMVRPGDPHVDDLIDGYQDLPYIAKPVRFGDLAPIVTQALGPAPRSWADPECQPWERRRKAR